MEKYLQTKDAANSVLVQLLKYFKQHQINPTPINYVVWYEYVLARNTELMKIINESLKAKHGFNDVVGYRAYQMFIKSKADDVVYINDDMVEATTALTSALKEVEQCTATHLSLIDNSADINQVQSLKLDLDRIKHSAIHSVNLANHTCEQYLTAHNITNRDAITKLYSRIKLDQDYKVYRSAGLSPGVLLIDIDHFLEIHRTHGVLVSDNILRYVAQEIKDVAGSKHAYCIAPGHDEFCIMTGASIQDGELFNIAKEILKRIEKIRIVEKNTHKVLAENMTATAILFEGSTNGLAVAYESAKKEMRAMKKSKKIKAA